MPGAVVAIVHGHLYALEGSFPGTVCEAWVSHDCLQKHAGCIGLCMCSCKLPADMLSMSTGGLGQIS